MQEEAAVIRLKALEDGIARAAGPKELSALSSALVDFHGEMVLLLHWWAGLGRVAFFVWIRGARMAKHLSG